MLSTKLLTGVQKRFAPKTTAPSSTTASSGARTPLPTNQSSAGSIPTTVANTNGSYGMSVEPKKTPANFDYSQVSAPTNPVLANTASSSAPSSVQRATLVNSAGNRVAVDVGSQQAKDYFGQGYTLEGAKPAATVATPMAPEAPKPTTSSAYNIQGSTDKAATSGAGSKLTDSSFLARAAQQKLTELQKNYLNTLAPTAEENAYNAELTDLMGAARMGISNEEGQGRLKTLDLVRGRQEKIGEQANIQAQTLQGQIKNLQDQRTAAGNVYNAQLGFEEKAIEREEAAAAAEAAGLKPIEIGGRLVAQNPETGAFEVIYEPPAESAKPVTLSEGQSLVDPTTGQVIASFGKTKDPLEQQKAELEIMKLQRELSSAGIELSPDQIADAVAKGYTTDQQLGLYSQIVGGGGNAPAIKEKSSEALKTQAFVNSGLASLSTLEELAPGGVFGRPLVPSGSYKAAERNVMDAIARLRTGAAMTPGEEDFYRQFLPQAGNSLETTTYKLNQIREYLSSVSSENDPLGISTGANDPLGLGAFSNDLSTSRNGSLGSLSEKYESGGNPGAIGYDRTGGLSYGTYQLAHNNAKSFVEQSPFKSFFEGIPFNSQQWQNTWKDLAKKIPEQFEAAQKDYISKTHFLPQIQKIASAGINVNGLNPVILDAIWSTAVQHGANTDVVEKALKSVGPNASDADKLKAIYQERWGGGARFASSTQAVKNSVYNRFFGPQGELQTALQRLGNMG